MARYYVSKNAYSNGEHEIHSDVCLIKLQPENRIYLDDYESCDQAVMQAKLSYHKANGCLYCCTQCHTS